MGRRLLTCLLLLSFVAGCTPTEKVAYRTIVGAKAFVDSAKKAYPECQGSVVGVCSYLRKATAAKDLMIDAVEVYCASPGFDSGKAACTPPTDKAIKNQLVSKLQAAIQIYTQAEKDLKGALK